MVVLSQDKKTIFTGKNFIIERSLGVKDKKYALLGISKDSASSRILAYYESEKLACDELEQIFAAMANGEKYYDLSE